MTEIAFLLDLVLNHKLGPAAKKRCIERIGEVEALLSTKPVFLERSTQPQSIRPGMVAQAPSTQALLDANPLTPPIVRAPIIPQEVVTSTTSGGSTRGPRKF